MRSLVSNSSSGFRINGCGRTNLVEKGAMNDAGEKLLFTEPAAVAMARRQVEMRQGAMVDVCFLSKQSTERATKVAGFLLLEHVNFVSILVNFGLKISQKERSSYYSTNPQLASCDQVTNNVTY